MWIKKINEFFENLSEYDNNSLVLHVAVDLIDMLKERVTFDLDDDCNVSEKVKQRFQHRCNQNPSMNVP